MQGSIIQNIANNLFFTNPDTLEYELDEHEFSLLTKEDSDHYHLKDNKLIFSSHDKIDYYAACYHASKIDIECINANANANANAIIVSTAFNLWEKSFRKDRKIAGLFLSLYEDDFEILQLLLESDRDPYDITSLADQYIKYAKNIDTHKLFKFFATIYKEKKQYTGIYSSLDDRLSKIPNKCQEIIKNFHYNIQPDTIQLYNIALLSLKKQHYTSAIDILIEDIEKNDNILSPQALWIIGRVIEKSDNKYRESDIFEVINKSISSPVFQISNSAVQAAVDAVGNIDRISSIIRNLLESNNQEMINSLSAKLSITKNLTSHDDFEFWLFSICNAAMNNDTLNSSIFHIFSLLAKDESTHDLLVNCIFIMIRNNSISEEDKRIEIFLHELTKKPTLTNKLFTLALIDENPRTAGFSKLVATYLFVHRSEHILEYDLSIINNFIEQDFILLALRTLGFISNETQLVSLILSLLQVKKAEKRTYVLVKDVIINEIAMDYPGYVQDELKIRKSNIKNKRSHILKLYSYILDTVDGYISSFNTLPRIKELEPPSSLSHNFKKEREKVSIRKSKLQEENSFIFQMASKITLKAGIASFNYNDFNQKGYSEPSYLHEYSSSYSLPRRYVMDNIGYEIRIVQLKCCKKDIV